MNIRFATIADAEAIAAIEAECFPAAEAATAESIRGRLEVFSNHFWLLEDEGRMIGFINGMCTDLPDLTDEMYDNANMHSEQGAWQMIFGVDTIPEYRRRGCAAMVMERVIADTRAQGRRGLVLTCKDRLVHFYAKFGFVNEGVSKSEHGGVIWYQMRLTF